jgi:hypothetical protein
MAVLRSFQGKDGNIDHQAMKQAMAAATKDISVRWWHGKPDVSETPIGYKPPDQVKAQIQQFGLAHLVAEIQPLGSIMAGYAGPRPWERLQDLTPKEKRQIEHRADRRKSRQSLRQWEDAGEE